MLVSLRVQPNNAYLQLAAGRGWGAGKKSPPFNTRGCCVIIAALLSLLTSLTSQRRSSSKSCWRLAEGCKGNIVCLHPSFILPLISHFTFCASLLDSLETARLNHFHLLHKPTGLRLNALLQCLTHIRIQKINNLTGHWRSLAYLK